MCFSPTAWRSSARSRVCHGHSFNDGIREHARSLGPAPTLEKDRPMLLSLLTWQRMTAFVVCLLAVLGTGLGVAIAFGTAASPSRFNHECSISQVFQRSATIWRGMAHSWPTAPIPASASRW